MKVTLVVDALTPQLSGIGRYTWELCTRLPQQPEIEQVSYFANGRFVDRPAMRLCERKVRRLRTPAWFQSGVIKRRLCQSLVHGPNFFLPPKAETGIITVHDLSVFRFPESHPTERLSQFERDFHSSLRRATTIITDTQNVREEFIAYFGVPEEQVRVVPLGVSRNYHPRTDATLRPILRQWGLAPQEYALCVSTLEPRKKIVELLRAWGELPAQTRASVPLVLAGAEGWLNESLREQIRDAATAGWLRHLGFVAEADLPSLYAGAALFLYPSIYEGFGLPPLEAMASGVPAVVASRSGLAEICGDAVAYVDPEDVKGFSATIRAALADPEWRDRSRNNGFERAADYSWENCIAQTIKAYGRQ